MQKKKDFAQNRTPPPQLIWQFANLSTSFKATTVLNQFSKNIVNSQPAVVQCWFMGPGRLSSRGENERQIKSGTKVKKKLRRRAGGYFVWPADFPFKLKTTGGQRDLLDIIVTTPSFHSYYGGRTGGRQHQLMAYCGPSISRGTPPPTERIPHTMHAQKCTYQISCNTRK